MALKRVWIGSPNYSSRGGAGVRLVVIHTAEGATTYQSLGNYFASSSSQVSSHTGIDDTPNTIGEYVVPANKAWTAASYNPVAIQTELCGFAAWTAADWADHPTMLRNCATWIAEECARYGLPITKLSASEAQGGGRGVCGHVDLGSGGGGHWDPGPAFPWTQVLDMACGGGGQPLPPDQPPKPEDWEMIASTQEKNGALHVFVVGAGKQAVWDSWQAKGQNGWSGGQAGKQVAKLRRYTEDVPDGRTIRGITADTNAQGVLHLFVTLDDASTLYLTGNQPGKLQPWAPKP